MVLPAGSKLKSRIAIFLMLCTQTDVGDFDTPFRIVSVREATSRICLWWRSSILVALRLSMCVVVGNAMQVKVRALVSYSEVTHGKSEGPVVKSFYYDSTAL